MLTRSLTFATMALCLGNAPVAPLIEGSFDGSVEAVKAARRCGFKQMRIQMHEELTMMFDEGGPTYGGTKVNLTCLARWTKKNAKRLAISWVPRDLSDY